MRCLMAESVRSFVYLEGFTMIPSQAASPPLVAVASGALAGWDLATMLGALTAAGVDALEVAIGPSGLIPAGDRDAARDLKQHVADAGVLVCGADATLEITLVDVDAAEVVKSAQALGAPFVRFFAPAFVPTKSLDDQMRSAQLALRELATTAQSMQPPVTILVEIAPNTLAASPELARRLIRERASLDGDDGAALGVIFDPGNMVAEGHLAADFAVALLGDTLHHVHVKNRVMVEEDGVWTATSQNLASGFVDWPGTVAALRASGYRGTYTLDHLSGPVSVAGLASDVYELRSMLASALESELTT